MNKKIKKMMIEYQSYGSEEILISILEEVKKSDEEEMKKLFVFFLEDNTSVPVEIIEFCMRELRWREILDKSLSILASDDFRDKTFASRIIAVYSDKWDNEDLYNYYRLKRG